MNKAWDAKLVSVETWKECLRVLKPGSFACVMSSPRQDVLSRMIVNLQDAGFRTDFTSLYWTYASGFPKAANISKLVDKRGGSNMSAFGRVIKQRRQELGLSQKDVAKHFPSSNGNITGLVWNWEDGDNAQSLENYNKLLDVLKLDKSEYPELRQMEREIVCKGDSGLGRGAKPALHGGYNPDYDITKSATEQAKALDGSYGGFQPKPAVEVVLMVMKPLSEKTFTDQALKNGKGVTWLDSGRIPFQDDESNWSRDNSPTDFCGDAWWKDIHRDGNPRGRFPANLLVEDDVLNDGVLRKSGKMRAGVQRKNLGGYTADMPTNTLNETIGDSGSFSRYFDLDKWFSTTFPFIVTPKPSTAEKNRGLDRWIHQKVNDGRQTPIDNPFQRGETPRQNTHPTTKPIKLMTYLISLVSRPGDVVLDPFIGSGTTAIAAKMLNRKWVGIELNPEYVKIANARINSYYVNS